MDMLHSNENTNYMFPEKELFAGSVLISTLAIYIFLGSVHIQKNIT
jgi:hypothetical protein